MDLASRIKSFEKLGRIISENKQLFSTTNPNTWFTPENIDFALTETSYALEKENLEKWTEAYPELKNQVNPKKIGVIMAGNIPLVGFHDFLSVLISGHKFVGKLSSKDDKLLPVIAKMLIDIDPEFKEYIRFEEERLSDFDAVIATGSNNSARYFEYYFGKYPNIIRKNRNSIAVLTGNESIEDLESLMDDIFMYYGLGCRNVSKLFLPENYDLKNIFEAGEKYKNIANHNKYSNNYGYNRSIYLMNTTVFWDNGFMLLKEDVSYASPVSVVYFENYTDINKFNKP